MWVVWDDRSEYSLCFSHIFHTSKFVRGGVGHTGFIRVCPKIGEGVRTFSAPIGGAPTLIHFIHYFDTTVVFCWFVEYARESSVLTRRPGFRPLSLPSPVILISSVAGQQLVPVFLYIDLVEPILRSPHYTRTRYVRPTADPQDCDSREFPCRSSGGVRRTSYITLPHLPPVVESTLTVLRCPLSFWN